MQDTSPEMYELQQKLIRAKSDEEKFLMTIDMYETSKAFVRSSIIHDNPEISASALKKEIFRRFYKNDFSEEEMNKILASF